MGQSTRCELMREPINGGWGETNLPLQYLIKGVLYVIIRTTRDY